MKAAVVCANGRVGRLVVKEAINRGLDVTAIAKGENKTAIKKYVCKNLFDLTAADLEGFDIVVDRCYHRLCGSCPKLSARSDSGI